MKVEIINFDDLSEKEKAGGLSNNGNGKEYANYLRATHNGETLLLESDAMEPEDKTFRRDLKWVANALEVFYELGKKEAEIGR